MLALDNPSYGHLKITQLPPHTPPGHTRPLLLHLRILTGRQLLVWSLPSGYTFSVHRLLSRDGSRNPTFGRAASQVKGMQALVLGN